MIIKALLGLIFTIIRFIIGLIQFPQAPEEWTTVIDTVFDLLLEPINFFIFLIGSKSFVLVSLSLLVSLLLADKIYKLCMWVLRKIHGS